MKSPPAASLEQFGKIFQPLFRQMQQERLFSQIDVPFHEGAVAYFGEKGIKATQ